MNSFTLWMLMAILVCLQCAQASQTTGVCTRTLYRQVARIESYRAYHSARYTYYSSCGFLWLSRCSRTGYRQASSMSYRTEYYSQAYSQSYCCPGYIGTAPTCQRVCPSLSPYMSNGNVDVNSTLVNSTAEYSCNSGYGIYGYSVLTCLSNGRWDAPSPSCRSVCPVLEGIANGAVRMTDENFVGSVATFTCTYGHGMLGFPSLTCLPNRTWSDTPPECYKLIMCPRLDSPDNGSAILQNRTEGVDSFVTYNCSSGYGLVGTDQRSCQMNGTWTLDKPTCERTCPNLEAPQNGNVNISHYFANGTATFGCDDGFGMNGSSVATCDTDGEWSTPSPSCEPVCPTPNSPKNGYVENPNNIPYFIGSSVTFACDEGFGINGSETITCLPDQTWSTLPTCERVCPPLEEIPDGSVNITSYFVNGIAEYRCDEGFKFFDSDYNSFALLEVIKKCCLDFGDSVEWFNTDFLDPVCKPIKCPRLSNPRGGEVSMTSYNYGGIATYSCSYGYKLLNGERRNCTKEGQWMPRRSPYCRYIPTTCGDLSILNGTVEISSQRYRGQAKYSCDTGYSLVGNEVRTCTDSGEWSGTEPHCQEEAEPPE